MAAPAVRVIDTDFNYHAYIDAYSSLRFDRKLWEIGSWELHINLQQTGAAELREGRLIFLDANRVGIIEKAEKSEAEDGVNVVAGGRELKSITTRRLTVPDVRSDTAYYGYDRYPSAGDPDVPAESIIKYYAGRHMVHPTDSSRKFPRLSLAANQQRGQLMRWSSRFEELSAVYQQIGEYCGMGYTIGLDLTNNQFIFDVVPLRDRTVNSDHPVVFSTEFRNLSNVQHTVDSANLKNAGYAGGAGEDENRLIQIIYSNGNQTGFDRREIWLDCGSIDDLEELQYEGQYKLADKTTTETVAGNTLFSGPFLYLQDWDLGDRITLQSKRLGIEADKLITEVSETYEADKTDIKVTFDKRKKTLLDIVKKTEVVR